MIRICAHAAILSIAFASAALAADAIETVVETCLRAGAGGSDAILSELEQKEWEVRQAPDQASLAEAMAGFVSLMAAAGGAPMPVLVDIHDKISAEIAASGKIREDADRPIATLSSSTLKGTMLRVGQDRSGSELICTLTLTEKALKGPYLNAFRKAARTGEKPTYSIQPWPKKGEAVLQKYTMDPPTALSASASGTDEPRPTPVRKTIEHIHWAQGPRSKLPQDFAVWGILTVTIVSEGS